MYNVKGGSGEDKDEGASRIGGGNEETEDGAQRISGSKDEEDEGDDEDEQDIKRTTKLSI